MERDFYNEDFEELIRQKADQYKMYPSDKVWKGVYSSLHTRRRKFVFGMSFLITGILFLAGKQLLMPGNHPVAAKNIIETNTSATKQAPPAEPVVIPGLKIQEEQQELYAEDQNRLHSGDQSSTAASIVSSQPVVIVNEIYNDPISQNINSSSSIAENNRSIVVENKTTLIENFPVADVKNEHSPSAQKTDESTGANKEMADNIKNISPESITKTQSTEVKKSVNWLEESATYELKTLLKTSRLSWQVYATPSVSFRTLSGGNNYPVPKTGVQYVPIALTHSGNPNDYVDHQPAMGYEAGGSLSYRLTRNLSLKAGLQFNFDRYSIAAYSSSPQQATISLSTYNYYYPNTITGYTNIQNFGGNSLKNLHNNYFQLSAPVGFELRVIGNGKLQFNIGATVQPTYLLNRNSYLLTTDYSDYTKAPTLFRRWNFNAGLEAFLTYKMGNFRWQIGPQIRYQLLSTYTSDYPIKENLKEYGIKIGISKTIW